MQDEFSDNSYTLYYNNNGFIKYQSNIHKKKNAHEKQTLLKIERKNKKRYNNQTMEVRMYVPVRDC